MSEHLPTRKEIRDALASEIVGFLGYEGSEIDETQISGEHEIEAFGTTRGGLPFGFRVAVLQVWDVDL